MAGHTGNAIDPWNLIWVIPAEGAMETAAIVFAGGDPVPHSVRVLLPDNAFVIAADSGLRTASSLKVDVDLVIGDLDSANPADIAAAIEAGAEVEQHPAKKDATDLELALDAALARGLTPVVVVGGAGWDRFDHLLANALLLASPRFAPLRPRWWVKGAHVTIVHKRSVLQGAPGDKVTLLAAGGPAKGVSTRNLRWPLSNETLSPGSTRGVSNEMIGHSATVTVEEGVLIAIRAGREY
jgi:thiamine pyrophosphokinase